MGAFGNLGTPALLLRVGYGDSALSPGSPPCPDLNRMLVLLAKTSTFPACPPLVQAGLFFAEVMTSTASHAAGQMWQLEGRSFDCCLFLLVGSYSEEEETSFSEETSI